MSYQRDSRRDQTLITDSFPVTHPVEIKTRFKLSLLALFGLFSKPPHFGLREFYGFSFIFEHIPLSGVRNRLTRENFSSFLFCCFGNAELNANKLFFFISFVEMSTR